MDLLEGLHRRLVVAALASTSRTSDSPPLTVGDVYQRLIPYRTVRGDLGVLELAEYEHALLRLLSGERGLVRLADPLATAELRRELSSVNPILGIYRDYAAVPLHLLRHDPERTEASHSPGGDPETAAARVIGNSRNPPPPHPSAAVAAGDVERAGREAPAAPGRAPDVQAPAADHAPASRDSTCGSCSRPLPPATGIRFCPHCGAERRLAGCTRCGTDLEWDWSFCVRCGLERG